MNIEIRNHLIFVDGRQVPFKQSPNGGEIITPEYQVMHHTSSGLTPGGDISWLTNPEAKASAHTVIAYDGSITQLMPLNRKTWHAGASSYKGRKYCNGFTIGHELDNPGPLTKMANGSFDGIGGPYPADQVVEMTSPHHGNYRYWLKFADAQLQTVFALVAAIDRHYGLKGVTTHWEISPGRKVDPGPHFPLERLRGLLAGRADAPADDLGYDGVVTARSGLNVRAWPSTTSKVIAQIENGAKVDIARSGMWEGETWHLITAGDAEGWVSGTFVEMV